MKLLLPIKIVTLFQENFKLELNSVLYLYLKKFNWILSFLNNWIAEFIDKTKSEEIVSNER